MWGFGGGRASGVHGGTDNLGSIVADFNRQLEQSLSTLNKMVDAVGKLKDGAKGATAAIHGTEMSESSVNTNLKTTHVSHNGNSVSAPVMR